MIPLFPMSMIKLALSWVTAVTEVNRMVERSGKFFDIDHLLPLGDEDRPRGVITFDEGVQSYEDFADDEIRKYHQHGSVSPLMSVIGRTGKTAQDFNMAAESDPRIVNPVSIKPEGTASSAGMTPENFGQTPKPSLISDFKLNTMLRTASNAFPEQELDIPVRDLIATTSVNLMSPFGR
jgi:hypothetical protein